MARVGQIIGKVAVKVVPDTTTFRRDAQNKLDREEDRLNAKARLLLDPTKLRMEALKAIRELNAHMRGNDAYKVRIPSTISKSGMREELRKAIRSYEALASTERIKIDSEVGKMVAELQLDKNRLKIVERELEHWKRKNSPIEIEVRPSMWTGAAAYVKTRLDILTRPREVQIIPVLNKPAYASVATALAALSGARVLNDLLDGLWTRLKRLDKAVPIIGTVAEAVAGLGAWGLTAASNLFALSQSLAQIGMAGLALPGIFGGMAIGLGASIAVFKDFNKVIPEFKDQLAKLQDQMSAKFWAKAEAPIRNLIDTLFPQFSAGLQRTADSLGTFFGSLSTALTGQLNGALGGMFDDLNESIEVFATHADSVATSIRVLGELGAGYLPRLAGWFGDINDSLANWLSTNQKNGNLFSWTETGIFQLQELGRALGNLGGFLRGLADIANASGGSTMSMFADTLQSMETAVKSQGFIDGLSAALISAHNAMSTIAKLSGPAVKDFFVQLGDTATKVFAIMGNTVGHALDAIFSALAQPAVGDGLVKMFQGIQTAVLALAPAMGPVGQALGSLMEVVGTLASVMGPVISVVLTNLANAVTQLAPAITPIIKLLGGGLLQVITALQPVFQTLVDVVGGILTTVVFPALSAILPMVIDGFKKIFEALQPLLVQIGELVAVLAPVLLPVLKFLASFLIDTLVMAVKGFINVLSGIISVVMGVIDVVAGLLTGDFSRVWEGLKGIVSGVWTAIKGIVQLALTVGIGGIFRKGAALLKGIWNSLWSAIKKAGIALFKGIMRSLKTFWKELKDSPKAPLTAVKNLFTNVWNAIKNFIGRVWRAIVVIFRQQFQAVKTVVSTVWTAIKSLFTSAFNAVRSTVRAGWNAIKGFFSGGIKGVLSKLRSMPGQIKKAFGNAGGILLGIGKKIISGLLDGIGSMFGKVKSKLSSLTKYIPDWKGPAKKDKTLLVNAGRIIIDGLIRGLESRFGQVKSSLTKLTNNIGEFPGLAKMTRKSRLRMAELLRVYENAAKSLKSAQAKLKALREEAEQYRESIRDTVLSTGNITSFGDDSGTSFNAIIAGLEEATHRAWAFAAAMSDLKKAGLSQTALDQIAQAGPQAGLDAARAILEAGQSGIAQINNLMSSLGSAAGYAGNVASDAMYQSGIQAAEGLVKGIESKMARIEKVMTRIAQTMVKTIKRQLGIKSPSRVFMGLGSYTMQGFDKGLVSVDLASTGASLISDLRSGMESQYTQVERSLKSFSSGIGGTEIVLPVVTSDLSSQVAGSIDGSVSEEGVVVKQLIYNAAPGNSLDSEEDLFAAASRARMAW